MSLLRCLATPKLMVRVIVIGDVRVVPQTAGFYSPLRYQTRTLSSSQAWNSFVIFGIPTSQFVRRQSCCCLQTARLVKRGCVTEWCYIHGYRSGDPVMSFGNKACVWGTSFSPNRLPQVHDFHCFCCPGCVRRRWREKN